MKVTTTDHTTIDTFESHEGDEARKTSILLNTTKSPMKGKDSAHNAKKLGRRLSNLKSAARPIAQLQLRATTNPDESIVSTDATSRGDSEGEERAASEATVRNTK